VTHHDDGTELRAFYQRYIEAFNARDEAGYADCFHLPVSILPLTDDTARAGQPPVVVTSVDALWPTLPATWTHSAIDDVRAVADGYVPRDAFTEGAPRRPVIQATVTRWAGDEPYEQVHVLYVLTREDGHLGIKAMVPLAVSRAAR
jgi:hypothetical protein